MARYSGTPTYPSLENKEVNFSTPSINPGMFQGMMTVLYQVQQHERLDKIASDFYNGRGDLWWIIAMCNGLNLPTDIKVGDIIRIPSDSKTVISMINSLNKSVIRP